MRRWLRDHGVLNLEMTLLVTFLVLTASVTLGGLGSAIACLYHKEAVVVDSTVVQVQGCGEVAPAAAMLGKIRIAYADTADSAVSSSTVTVSDASYSPKTILGIPIGGGTYTYTATSPGYYPEPVRVPVDAKGNPTPVTVTFRPIPIDFTVTALDAVSGDPLDAATLVMADSVGYAVSNSPRTTNALGQATFSISKTDTYTVTASKDGYADQVSQVFIKVGGAVIPTRTASVAARPLPGSVVLVVQNPAGTLLPGASVVMGSLSAVVDSAGHATFTDVSVGTYSGMVSDSPTYVAKSFTAKVTAKSAVETTVTLQYAPGSADVTAKATDGALLAGALVTLNGTTVMADSSGLATFASLPAGTYAGTVSDAPNFTAQAFSVSVVAGVKATSTVTLPNAPGSAVVTVKATNGSALVGATVTLNGQSVASDGSGLASFTGLVAGTYSGSVSASGYFTQSFSVTVPIGHQVSVTVSPVAPGSLSVAVPAGGVGWQRLVAVYDSSNNLVVSRYATKAAPTPVFTGLAPGLYTVSVYANGVSTATATLQVNAATRRNYALVSPGIVAGQGYSLTNALAPN